jgi:hypothetical protein
MRRTYSIVLLPGGDERAVGGAVTVALCGHWDHDGPCRWPHRTSTARDEAVPGGWRITVEVECAADEQQELVDRIDAAVASGAQAGPDGRTSEWRVNART